MNLVDFPDYFLVKMNQGDIDTGVMNSTTSCALALAFKRFFPGVNEPSSIEVDIDNISFTEVDFLDEGEENPTRYTFKFDLDDDIQLHVQAFDLDKKRVRPIEMHVNITEISRDPEYPEVDIYGDVSLHENFNVLDIIENADYLAGQIRQDWAKL